MMASSDVQENKMVVVPTGHIVVNAKWHSSELTTLLKSKFKVLLMGDIGTIDLYPSTATGLIYLPESDLMVETSCYKKRIKKLHSSTAIQRKYVFMEINNRTQHLLSEIQQWVVIQLKMKLLCFSSIEEAAHMIVQLVMLAMKPHGNPFTNTSSNVHQPLDSSVLSLVREFKGVGSSRTGTLLEKYKSVKSIMDAPYGELVEVVGVSAAKNIHDSLQT